MTITESPADYARPLYRLLNDFDIQDYTDADAFTTAARAEAEKRADLTAAPEDFEHGLIVGDFMAGAEWARTHLAAQEPTEAEIEAAARSISAEQDRRIGLKAGAWWGGAECRRNLAREDARAALSAARAARRDEEKREALAWRMRDWEEVERLQDERRDEEQA